MNFATLALDDDTLAFWAEVRRFFDEHVTEEVLDEDRQTGGGFSESLHLAMGERGWIAPGWPVAEGGAGLDAVRQRIVAHELARSGAPAVLTLTTMLPPVAIRLHADEELKRTVLAGVANGTMRICLGYTEPDCGSDLAAVRTRAVRDGDEWIVNGQKMFTTGAQFCQYCLCLTRTDPDVAKHKGLTVFLLPLDLPGVEIRPIETLGGERTNFVHLDDVRVPDRYRLGGVNEGWAVMSAPLAQEHGMADADETGAVGEAYLAHAVSVFDAVGAWAAVARDDSGRLIIDDPTVRQCLAEVAVAIESARVAPGAMGRIMASENLISTASALLDLLGPIGLLAHGADGAIAGGLAEHVFRLAPGTAIYGGSTEIHRNMIAERLLGLPRSTPRG